MPEMADSCLQIGMPFNLSACRGRIQGTHQWESIRENASKAFHKEEEEALQLAADESRSLRSSTKSTPSRQRLSYWKGLLQERADLFFYNYYNWR